ncbi:cytochrome P450 [Marasmius fiardii PR-910]|nr:cytochrome P450 [Marasmius fiardii PR-910]
MPSLQLVTAALTVPIITYILFSQFQQRKRNSKGLPLPPGPPQIPFFGNATQILGKNMVTVFSQWAKEYGPVVYLRLFGQPVILLNTAEAAEDLLEKRSKNYSGRPNSIMASTAMQGDMMMPFIHANDRFRRVRKLVETELRPTAVTEHFNPIQAVEVHRLVHRIIHDPSKWSQHIATCIASMLTTVVYDKPLKGGQETAGIIKDVIRLNDELINALDSGQNYVDFLPWLQYIPGIPYKAKAAAYYELAERTYKTLMDEAKANYESGKPAKGIAARLLQKESKGGDSREKITTGGGEDDDGEPDYREQYWALATFYLAGSDTQSIASQSLVLALALNPDIMKKAQDEVDRVVGPDRVPTFADEPNLPYIRALAREVLRWRPTGPTGAIPHASVEDDEYKGYFIPRGAMQQDPKVFPEPEKFNPERYIENPNLPLYAFSFGRRGCPARRVSEQTLLLEFATVAWALNISKAKDPQTGEEIPLNADRETGYSPVGLLRPLPFQVSITPRSEERTRLLERIVESEELSLIGHSSYCGSRSDGENLEQDRIRKKELELA